MGVAKRTLEYWCNKLVDAVSYHTFFSEKLGEAARISIAECGGEVVGYAYYFIWSKAGKPIIFSKDAGILTEIVASTGKPWSPC